MKQYIIIFKKKTSGLAYKPARSDENGKITYIYFI